MIRKTIYRVSGQPITLAYVPCIGDAHPEVPQSTADLPPEPKADRAPYVTARRIRLALGRDPEPRQNAGSDEVSERLKDRVAYEATVHRIARQGF